MAAIATLELQYVEFFGQVVHTTARPITVNVMLDHGELPGPGGALFVISFSQRLEWFFDHIEGHANTSTGIGPKRRS